MTDYPATLIVDRIAGDHAVCEAPDKSLLTLPLGDLPRGITEGDVLRLIEARYQIDTDETAKRREQNYDLFRSIFHKP